MSHVSFASAQPTALLFLLAFLHDALVDLRVGVDLVLQRVQLQLADAVELVGHKRHVRRERTKNATEFFSEVYSVACTHSNFRVSESPTHAGFSDGGEFNP